MPFTAFLSARAGLDLISSPVSVTVASRDGVTLAEDDLIAAMTEKIQIALSSLCYLS